MIDCRNRVSFEVGFQDGYEEALDAESEVYRAGGDLAAIVERVRDLCSSPSAWSDAARNAGIQVSDWEEYDRGAQAGAEHRLAELDELDELDPPANPSR